MHIRVSCFVVVCLVAAHLHAQEEKVAGELKVSVHKMLDATINGDYDTLVGMTHPKAIEAMGGADKAKQLLKLSLDSLKASGFVTKLQEVGTPTVLLTNTSSFAVVPYTVIITGAGKKITSKTAVVGFSSDAGKTWKFLNVTEKGEEGMRQLMPDLPQDLKFPKMEQKVEEVK
jgi:hypothetical protein